MKKIRIGDIVILTCRCCYAELGLVESVNDPDWPSIRSGGASNAHRKNMIVIDHMTLKQTINVFKTIKAPKHLKHDEYYYKMNLKYLSYWDDKNRPYMIRYKVKR